MAELICPTHGPYDAAHGACPYCSGSADRPPAPQPLMDDEMPTDLGAGPVPAGGGHAPGGWDDEAPTDLGYGRQAGAGFLDSDEDPTELGAYRQRDDVTELDMDETGLLGILWVKDGRRRGRIHKIKDGATAGRSQGDVMLDDPKASNPHAKFTIEDDQFVVWDFGSRNGTSVNGERIRAATPLKENDTIKIGDTVFVLKVLS